MIKIINFVGARPQFIKSSVISREIKKNKKIKEIIVHSGQHYDKRLSSYIFQELQIPKPKYNLKVKSAIHPLQISNIINKFVKVLKIEKPDWVIVYGDTNTTLAGALASNRMNIKVAHIESGIRSYNNQMPEEINRVLTDNLSTLLFCPTSISISNLKKENIKKNIYNVGDVMFDNYLFYNKKNKSKVLSKYRLIKNKYIILTIHRAQNLIKINILKNIINCFNEISLKTKVIFPVHPNTKKIILKNKIDLSNILVVDPTSYLDMMQLIKNSKFIATDSGGLQKESLFAKKQIFTIRDETEWPETLTNKNNILCSPKYFDRMKNIIIKNFDKKFIESKKQYFGSGRSSKKIINIINNYKD